MAGNKQAAAVLVASNVPYSRMLLKQTLQQQDCEVLTANDVREALRRLQDYPFDLLLIDLTSREGAGEQLLIQTRVMGNRVPILLCSTELSRDLLRRLSNLQPVGFVGKPLNVEVLVHLLPLALDGSGDLLRESAEQARLQGTSGATAGLVVSDEPDPEDPGQIDQRRLQAMFGSLPLLPHVLLQILALSGEEQSAAAELARVIAGDPRLSGQLLRIVNSAYFGFARRISTIPEAAVVLGNDAIRNLAMGAAVANFFGGRSKLLDRGRMWRHALAVAVASRMVAANAGMAEDEEAFAAGLLHDFGRLAMERHLPDEYAGPLQLSRSEGMPLIDAERQVLGTDHAEVGGQLAAHWNLPPILGEALRWHHEPESADEVGRQVAAAVHAGDLLCHAADLGGVDGAPPTIDASAYALTVLEFDLEAGTTMIPEVVAETESLGRQLAVATAS